MFKSLHKPKALRWGDTLALIRPASRLDVRAYAQTIRSLRDLGFCVATYPGSLKADSYFSFADHDRAREFVWAFSEPGIKAVLSCRGGYGSVRLVHQLKKSDLKKMEPKLFVGYSDTTYLHQFLQNEKKMLSFHGPLVGQLSKQDLHYLMRQLCALSKSPATQTWSEIENIGSSQRAHGRLVGGNLSVLQVTGPAQLPKEPLILILEDVNENYYRLDRMLWTLIDAGYARYIRGMIIGHLEKCGKDDRKTFKQERLYQTLRSLCRGPIWVGARFGHGLKRQRILPLGARIELHGHRLKILESCVLP